MITPDSVWYHFTIPAAQNAVLQRQHNLVIDQYDTKWFCSQDLSRTGLFYFNENKTYDDPSDDRSGFLNKSNGLNDNFVTSVVVDRRGDVWVGTSFGINIISNTNTALSSD
jgi:ligand-binding sensor domain-containing protein